MPEASGSGFPRIQPAYAFNCDPYWLSRGLVGMVVPRWGSCGVGFGLRGELAKRRQIVPTGSPVLLVDALGVCFNTGVSTKYYSVTLPELAAPIAWTVVALVKSTGGSGGSSNTIACINYDGTTVPLNLNISVQSSGGVPAGASFFSGSWDSCLNITDINNDNKWHTVGGVFSKQAARLEFWLDGKLDVAGTTTHDPSSHTNTNPLDIATYRNDSRTFIGSIAGVAVFSQALSNVEMETLTGALGAIWRIAQVPSRRTYFVPSVVAQAATTSFIDPLVFGGAM